MRLTATRIMLVCMVAIAGLVMSCAKATPTPTATPVPPTPTPTATRVPATPTPTATPIPPTPTPTIPPWVTPTPTTAVVVTPTPTKPVPTATPILPTPTPTVKAKYGGIFRTSYSGDPTNFDPHSARSTPNMAAITSVFAGIIRMSQVDKSILPDLAERWEMSPDGKTWTFHLRDGIRFHDGSPITAEDVAYNVERYLWADNSIIDVFLETFGVTAKATDARTVVVQLKTACGETLQWFANSDMFLIVPKKVGLNPIKNVADLKKVGSGPFRFVSYERGGAFKNEKNPDYWDKTRPYLDGIEHYGITDASTRFAALRTGRVDYVYAGGITSAQLGICQKDCPNLKCLAIPGSQWWKLTFNLNLKPWNDYRARKAIHLILDRWAAVEAVSIGRAGKVGSFFSPGMGGLSYEEVAKMPGYRKDKTEDVAEAHRLLAELGYKPGELTMKLLYRPEGEYREAAQFYADAITRAGIKVTLDTSPDVATFLQRQMEEGFEVIQSREAVIDTVPSRFIMNHFTSAGVSNYAHWKDAELETLAMKVVTETDVAKKSKLLVELDALALKKLYDVSFHWDSYVHGMAKYVRNYDNVYWIHEYFNNIDTWLDK